MSKATSKRKNKYQPPPLPIGAVVDDKLNDELKAHFPGLPESLPTLLARLKEVEAFVEFDAALHLVNSELINRLPQLFDASKESRKALLEYASSYFPTELCVPICRRMANDPVTSLRKKANKLARTKLPPDVALPSNAEGPWDFQGWEKGTKSNRLYEHSTGPRVLEANQLPVLNNIGELRELLRIPTAPRLGYLLLGSDMEDGKGPYTKFSIAKRSGEPREICAPTYVLKHVQRHILKHILEVLPVHDTAHGFVKERSTVTNAAVHQGQKLLVKFDLHNFFPTISYYRVMGLFAQMGYPPGYGYFSTDDTSDAIAPVLARLTTYHKEGQSWSEAALPQGAPTSPTIANLICRGLDARLHGLATKAGGRYTRYADDLTFSFGDEPAQGLGRFRWWVDQICQQEGFVLNQHKYRVIRSSQRQMVTGIVVNDTLRIPRKERRRFRAILHNCRTHGLASQAKGNPRFSSYLQGFASYINMVHPEEGARLMQEVNDILAQHAAENDDA